jgi:lysophospholipase L1-like esterase
MTIRRRTVCSVVIAALLTCGAASAGEAAAAKFSAPKNFVLALGDSLAFGFQEAKFEDDPFALAQFHTGFAFVFTQRVRATPPGKGTTLINLGCPGETTGSFLAGPCAYQDAGLPLHVAYPGAQLDAAQAFLLAHRGQVSPILISLGANDVLALADDCLIDRILQPDCVLLGFMGVLDRYGEILARLRVTAPDAEIVVLGLYNPLALNDPTTNVLAAVLNDALATVAAANRVRFADPLPAFNLAAPQPATLCFLTLVCTLLGDIHPSDAGYALIGDLMFEVAGFTRFEH